MPHPVFIFEADTCEPVLHDRLGSLQGRYAVDSKPEQQSGTMRRALHVGMKHWDGTEAASPV
jgi:hypothetical protein